MQICAIDNGYYNTKVKTSKDYFMFRSKIQEFNEEQVDADTFEIFNKIYTIGNGKDTVEIKKIDNEIHRVCTIASLGMLTNDIEEFKVVTALPMGHYLNRDLRDKFKKYLTTPNIVHIKHQDKKKIIIIKDLVVFMQGASALYAHNPEQYRNKIVAIIDIGGLTTNGCIFENLKPIPESIFTINSGMIILYNKIKTTINQQFCLNIQDYEIPHIIDQYTSIVDSVISKHIQEIIREMRTHNWSIETLPILGVGGGVLELESYIKKYFPKLQLSQNPLYDNVVGLFNIGKVIFS